MRNWLGKVCNASKLLRRLECYNVELRVTLLTVLRLDHQQLLSNLLCTLH